MAEVGKELHTEARPRYSAGNTVMFIVRSIWEYDRWLLAIAPVLAITRAAERFVPMLMPKYVIDQVTAHGDPIIVIAIVAVSGLVLAITQSVSTIASNNLSARFTFVRLCLIARSGKKFMTTDFQNLEDPAVLDLAHKGDWACVNNNEGLEGVMRSLMSLLERTIVLAGSTAVIVTLHPLMLLLMGFLFGTRFILSSRARILAKQENDSLTTTRRKSNYLSNVMQDFAFGKDIRLFGMKNLLVSKFRQENNQLFAGRCKILTIWLRHNGVQSVIAAVQELITYGWLCWSVLAGQISIGDFTMYVSAVSTLSGAVGGLLDDISHVRLQNVVINDFRSFLDYPDRPSGSERLPASLAQQGCAFSVENVSFRYPGHADYALRNVSLQIRPGERLAIVGLNGAGKTTFVKLLTRLYEPNEGQILLNGVDIRTYDKQEYYKLFSIVFQEIKLFAFTVLENVAMKEHEKTDRARLLACLELAGLAERVKSLPKGVDTSVLKIIDEDGIEFSGGENQKLALARALYKNAPVVILDEPTAALDALAEAKLYREFNELVGRRTAIYISHRLASTRFCDRVAVFEAGRIIEMGTHDELVAKGGRYAELYLLQAKYYREGVQTA